MKYQKALLSIVHRILGLKVPKYMSEFKKVKGMSEFELDQYQINKLDSIYRHAVNSSPWYQRLMVRNNVSIKKIKSISDFKCLPIIEKNDLQKISSESKLPMIFKDAFLRKTAGTSGVFLKVALDRDALSAQLAARYCYYKKYGIEMGDREARLWGRSDINISPKKNYLLNRKQFNFLQENKESFIKEAEKLIQYRPDYIYGYSSLVVHAATMWNRLNLPKIKLKAVICTAEMLSQFQRDMVKNVFRCPVIMEYGCSEVDIIASESLDGNYIINTANVFFEMISNGSDIGEVIVTDLNNRKTPIVRYRLGDICQINDSSFGWKNEITSICSIIGRTSDQLVKLPSGNMVHSVVYSNMFNEVVRDKKCRINQFRIIQISSDLLELKIDIDHDNDKTDEIKMHIIRKANALFEEDIKHRLKFEKISIEPGKKYTYFESLESYNSRKKRLNG